MQTKKGAAARGPTAEEFLHVMEYFKEKALAVKSDPRFKHSFNQRAGLHFSYDNPPIHRNLPLQDVVRVPLPPRSPDMHKVIEHKFGILTRQMNASLAKDDQLKGVAKYKAELERLFHSISAESVHKDVLSLESTYSEILKVQGNWPPAKFR